MQQGMPPHPEEAAQRVRARRGPTVNSARRTKAGVSKDGGAHHAPPHGEERRQARLEP
jgi:hypothetical protein